MAENPLLPNAELRALRAWTKHAQKRSKSLGTLSGTPPRREALLAATLMQLRPGDTLVPAPGDTTALALLTPKTPRTPQTITALHAPAPETHLLAAVGLAAAAKRSGADRLVLTFTHAGLTSTPWTDALTWAQTDKLPLILAVADASGPNAFQPAPSAQPAALTWTSLGKLARKLKLPVLSVDGEDAVAVYRVMQESVLRARSGAGPAVLWAILPTLAARTQARGASATPLGRLERYLRTRNIPL